MTRPIPAAEFAGPRFGPPEFGTAEAGAAYCWKRIGTEGDKSCGELSRHAHCRNCPTFSLAAAALLDRKVSAEALESGTAHSAARPPSADAHSESATVFRLGDEWFALPTLAIDEVTGMRPIHSLPHRRSSSLLGLANVRGELVLCLSITELLVGKAASASAQARLIVVRPPAGRLALPVDEVLHVHHYARSELQPLPTTLARSPSRFTQALLPCGERMIGLVDEQVLFAALSQSLA